MSWVIVVNAATREHIEEGKKTTCKAGGGNLRSSRIQNWQSGAETDTMYLVKGLTLLEARIHLNHRKRKEKTRTTKVGEKNGGRQETRTLGTRQN